MSDYFLCGWRVRSELPLPELLPWLGDDRLPDIHIRLGTVPDRLAAVSASDTHGCFAPDGTFLTREASVAYLVDPDSEVTVDTTLELASPVVRAIFYGTVLGVLCHRRAIFPLHASCPVVSGRAVALAGRRDVGKSALASILAKRGCGLLADDITPVTWRADSAPVVLPAVPCLRLQPALMASLGLFSDNMLAPAYGKAAIPALAEPHREAAPLVATVHLRHDPVLAAPLLDPLSRQQAIGPLYDACFRGRLAGKMGLGDTVFRSTARLAVDCPNYRLTWDGAVGSLDRVADLIMRTAAHGA